MPPGSFQSGDILSPESLATFEAMKEWWMTQTRAPLGGPRELVREPPEIFRAKTTTHPGPDEPTGWGTYPTSPADTFVVQHQVSTFTRTPGTQSITDAAAGLAYDIGRAWDGNFIAENTKVLCLRIEDHLFIWPDPTATTLRIGKVGTAQITVFGSGSVDLWSGAIGAEADDSESVTASDWAGFGRFYPDQKVLLEPDDTGVYRLWAPRPLWAITSDPYAYIVTPVATTTSGMGTGVTWTNNGVTDGAGSSGIVSDKSMVFDGSADHFEIGTTATTIDPAASWTFSGWFKFDVALNADPLWTIGPDASTRKVLIEKDASNDLTVTTDGGDSVSHVGTTFSTGTWYFIVVVWDAARKEFRLWIDGVGEVFTGQTGATALAGTDIQKIGTNLAETTFLDGDADQVFISEGMWDQATIDYVYNAGSGRSLPE